MGSPKKTNEFYQFSVFRLDAAERRLWRGDERLQLTPKQFDLLFYFVENAGRVVKKSELLDAVWANTYVEETTLARNVSWLRKLLGNGAGGEPMIETVPKLGYCFTTKVIFSDENSLIIEEETVQYTRGEETIIFDDEAAQAIFRKENEPQTVSVRTVKSNFRQSFMTPLMVAAALAVGIFAGVGFVNFNRQSKPDSPTEKSSQPLSIIPEKDANPLKIGSIVHLKNQSNDDAGYLDVWGEIKNKPEFRNIPTEVKFVSTHPNPNRENGSGSWKIVSARGKKDGEPLIYGDKIHLQSIYPDGGFLDNCGWLVDMPIFSSFVKSQKFAVFTTATENRDKGTGTWIVGSNTEYEGNPVIEGAGITLENGFPVGGYLNVQGFIEDVPAFNDYDGAQLVFIHAATPNRRPNAGVWTVSNSNVPSK